MYFQELSKRRCLFWYFDQTVDCGHNFNYRCEPSKLTVNSYKAY